MLDSMLDLDLGRSLPLLVDAALKSLAVSAAALVALPLLHRASAAARHLVLLAGLGVLLGLPALMPLLPRQSLPHSPRAEPLGFNDATPRLRGQKSNDRAEEPHADGIAPAQAGAGTAEAQGFSPGKKSNPRPTPLSAALPLPQPRAKMFAPVSPPPVRPAWLILGWLLGALACTGRILTTQTRVRRLTRHCLPLPPSLLSAVPEAGDFAARKSGPAGTPPMVWGWPRSVLLLPPEAADWPPARLRAVVQHEAAHVHRHDWLTQTLAQAACAVYWFNPLVWLLAARTGAEAERACDDAVLLSGVPPADYALHLLAVARALGAGQRASFGAVTMARRSPVRGRLEAILDARRPRRRATRSAAALALAVTLAVAAPLASLRPAARADAPADTQPAPPAGVPTEADIARVQQHLQSMEQARAAYAAAHPNTLTPAQANDVDQLIEATEFKRRDEEAAVSMAAQNASAYKQAWAEAKKPHTKKERQVIWQTIFMHDHPGPDRGGKIVAERQRIRNLRFAQSLAQLKQEVATLPADQVARETCLYAYDGQIALDETRIEAMQMERAEGYSLHLTRDDIASYAHMGFWNERRGVGSRALWVLTELLNRKLNQKGRLDDADVDALAALLREPHKTPSVDMATVLALFRDMREAKMRPVPPSQQQKIREAVTPFLTSRSQRPTLDKLVHKFAKEVLHLYGGSAPTPPPPPKAQVRPAARQQATHQSIPQANQTGVSSMTPLRSMRAALLKTTAFATLAAGLTLPAAHAQPPTPVPAPQAAPPASTPKPTSTFHWISLVLQQATLGTVRALTGWDRNGTLPEGVDRVYFLESTHSILVHATPAGRAHMQEVINAIDVAPRQVQIKVAFVTVTAADLNASGLHFDRIPMDRLENAGKPPQKPVLAADGSAVTAYLATIVDRRPHVFGPTSTTNDGTPAQFNVEIGTNPAITDPLRQEVFGLEATPRLNKDGSIALQLRLTGPDEWPAAGSTPGIKLLRTIRNGDTLVLVNPFPLVNPPAGANDRDILVFVTPTVLPGPKDAAMPTR